MSIWKPHWPERRRATAVRTTRRHAWTINRWNFIARFGRPISALPRKSRRDSALSMGAGIRRPAPPKFGRPSRRMFENFWGNGSIKRALAQMISSQRIPQTLLFSGPEGVGKATLARRFAAELLGSAEKIEQDDLSLPHNTAIVSARERWPAEKR